MTVRLFKIITVLMLLCAMLSGICAYAEYDVTLPAGYEAAEARYPVVYLLPQDGYAADQSGIAEKLTALMESGACAPMIIVRPAFEAGSDLHDVMRALVTEIDSRYRTMADAEHRVLMGTGTGGYLAYALGLTQADGKVKPVKACDLFACLVSIRGDFVSGENPWYAQYGDMADLIELMNLSNPGIFNGFYTYMDAPVGDSLTNMEGSTNSLGALFIEFGTGSAAHEYTVRPGAFDDAFLSESVARAADRLTKRMFPPEEVKVQAEPAQADETPVVSGDTVKIELMGDWRFMYTGAKTALKIEDLTAETTKDWPLVRPGQGNWTKGYGNISDENVSSAYGPDYFDFFIVGNGYYVKTFELPENFKAEEMLLSAGYVDDRCEVYLNGVLVGATGIDEDGMPDGETTWAVHSLFELDPALLVPGGENTLVVRAWNDLPYGAGGWYGGPVGIYSRKAYEDLYGALHNERFYEETFVSEYGAAAHAQAGTIDNEYLIYLPPDYFENPDRRYPTVYLLHQFNSDHTSYRVDKVNELFDQGIAEGRFDDMIVVIPNSSEDSWWADDWETMITAELIPHIDSKYRTIRDARYRLTAGCSMGGQGAMAVALRNPDAFSGAVSFYGAFSYGGMNSPNVIAAAESAEYLDYFSLYFICGNQDSYGFGVPAIELNRQLEDKGVAHRFFIDNGGHDSAFYLPNFIDAFSYIRSDMYHAGEALDALLEGKITADAGVIRADMNVLSGIEAYHAVIPESSYTINSAAPLQIALTLRGEKDGETLFEETVWHEAIPGSSAAICCDVPEGSERGMTLTLTASVLDRCVKLDETVKE